MPAIEIDHISKSYGQVSALHEVSFKVQDRELFGLIGPDGAGKSTLFRILTTLLLADSGKATVCGYDVVKEYRKIRKIAGYMPGKFSLYQDLSVLENLEFFATIFGSSLDENDELIRVIYQQLEPFKNRPAGKLSGGMKQKLALCCALIHRPSVLFLDEPTTGVDAVSRKEFWEMLQGLREKGIAILVSTPYMDEASLCDRIALIQNGQVLSIDAPKALTASYDRKVYAVTAERSYPLLKALRNMEIEGSCLPFGDAIHLATTREIDERHIKQSLEKQGFSDVNIQRIEPGVEDVFLGLSSGEEIPGG